MSTKSIAVGSSECADGGVKLTPGGNICNGTTGFTKTLPAGETETGTWAANNNYVLPPETFRCIADTGKGKYEENECLTETTKITAGKDEGGFEKEVIEQAPPSPPSLSIASISFSIPLGKELEASEVHYMKVGETSADCGGSTEAPTATPGNLCVYESSSEHASGATLGTSALNVGFLKKEGALTSGTFVRPLPEGAGSEEVSALGTWAFTEAE